MELSAMYARCTSCCLIKLLPNAEYLARFLRMSADVKRICLVTGPSGLPSVNSGYGALGAYLFMACNAASGGYCGVGAGVAGPGELAGVGGPLVLVCRCTAAAFRAASFKCRS